VSNDDMENLSHLEAILPGQHEHPLLSRRPHVLNYSFVLALRTVAGARCHGGVHINEDWLAVCGKHPPFVPPQYGSSARHKPK
jgi:hypothetical protein